jgi:uncharacterized membrane protein
MNSPWKFGGWVILLLLTFLLGGMVSHSFTLGWSGEGGSIKYTDLVAIILTALSVIVTVLAIFLAVLGVLGWNSISRGVQDRATEFLQTGFAKDGDINKEVSSQVQTSAQTFLESQFAEGGAMREVLRAQVEAYIYQGVGGIQPEDDQTDGDGKVNE